MEFICSYKSIKNRLAIKRHLYYMRLKSRAAPLSTYERNNMQCRVWRCCLQKIVKKNSGGLFCKKSFARSLKHLLFLARKSLQIKFFQMVDVLFFHTGGDGHGVDRLFFVFLTKKCKNNTHTHTKTPKNKPIFTQDRNSFHPGRHGRCFLTMIALLFFNPGRHI